MRKMLAATAFGFVALLGLDIAHATPAQSPATLRSGPGSSWKKIGKIPAGADVQAHFYDAGHAFFNDARPEAYTEDAAKLAWSRTLAFLRDTLA